MRIRHAIAIIPAVIFWLISMVFFVFGLSISAPQNIPFLALPHEDIVIIIAGVSILMALANTLVQMIGWDTSREELGWILTGVWLTSYGIGITTNVISIQAIFNMDPFIERIFAWCFGTLIEVSPERLFVLAWRSIWPKNGQPFFARGKKGKQQQQHKPFSQPLRPLNQYRPSNQQHKHYKAPKYSKGGYPNDMTREEYKEYLALVAEDERDSQAMKRGEQPHWIDLSGQEEA